MMRNALETERDFRKQVRKAYYMREEDFATLREYNDYLEEVEDIVYELLHEETRIAGRAKLDARRVASSEITARNRAKLEADKRALSESISSQAHEAQQRAELRSAEARQAAELQRKEQQEMHEQIATGRTSAATAQAELALRRAEVAARAPASSSGSVKQEQSGGYSYVPERQARVQAAVLAQPLDQALALERHPADKAGIVVHAVRARAEQYEADPTQLRAARQAGGYHRNGYQLWTYRYREQAFDAAALLQGMAAL